MQKGILGVCTKYINKKTGKEISPNVIDQYKCCLQTNKPIIESCLNMCSKIEDQQYKNYCFETCNDIFNSQREFCITLHNKTLGVDNPMYNPLLKLGCIDTKFTNKNIKCIKKNKDILIEECLSNCVTNKQVNCQNLCNFTYEASLLTDEFKNPVVETYYVEKKSKSYKYKIICIFIISFAILILYISLLYLLL